MHVWTERVRREEGIDIEDGKDGKAAVHYKAPVLYFFRFRVTMASALFVIAFGQECNIHAPRFQYEPLEVRPL